MQYYTNGLRVLRYMNYIISHYRNIFTIKSTTSSSLNDFLYNCIIRKGCCGFEISLFHVDPSSSSLFLFYFPPYLVIINLLLHWLRYILFSHSLSYFPINSILILVFIAFIFNDFFFFFFKLNER